MHDYTILWYQGLALVGTNVAMLPVIALAFFHWSKTKMELPGGRKSYRVDFAPYLVDTAIFLRVFIVSTFYHTCHAEWLCLSPMDTLRVADHVQVWTAMMWIYLIFLSLERNLMFSVFIIMEIYFMIFPYVVINTVLFPITFAPAALLLIFLRVSYAHIPILKYDVLFGAVAILLFVGGMFFIAQADIYDDDFWWVHSTWHVLAMSAIFFLYLDLRGFSVTRFIGIHSVTKTIAEAEDDIRAAAIKGTQRFVEKYMHHRQPRDEEAQAVHDDEAFAW